MTPPGPPARPCSFPSCGRPRRAKGLCDAHRKQLGRGEELRPIAETPGTCLTCGVAGKHYARGLCKQCYQKEWRQAGPRCRIDDCSRPRWSGALCCMHAKRLAKWGDPEHVPVRKGKPWSDARRAAQGRSKSVMPDGWDAPMVRERPAGGGVSGGVREIPLLEPLAPEVEAQALRGLQRHGAEDLAAMLGLLPA